MVRDQRVWFPHPLGIPTLPQHKTMDSIAYDELFYYITPLLEAEVELKISQLMKIQTNLETRKKKITISTIPTNSQEWEAILVGELSNISGLTAGARHSINLYMGEVDRYREYIHRDCLTPKQLAVLLALSSFINRFRPYYLMTAWPGVKHLFKSRDQLLQEVQLTAAPISLRSRSGCISKCGLQRTYAKPPCEKILQRLAPNSFVLSSIDTSSQTTFETDYHTMMYYSWLTFLSPNRWLAMFYFYESHEHDSFASMMGALGDNTTGKVEVFNIKERFDLDPFTIQKGDAAIKTLYEIGDEEWDSAVPGANRHTDILQALSGCGWDMLEMI